MPNSIKADIGLISHAITTTKGMGKLSYLYTSEPTSFISENVGNKTKGSYIVKYLSNDRRFYSYKVIGLKNDTLTVYFEPDENAIGGNSKRGLNIVYKRLK